jgi:hypothetical protein
VPRRTGDVVFPFFSAGHDRIGSVEQRSVAGKNVEAVGSFEERSKEVNVGTLDSRGRSDLEIDLHKLCNQNNANDTTKIDSTDGSRRSSIFEQTSRSTTSAEQIDLNNKFRRDKPDESDTKMIRINVIRRGFGPIYHGDQTNSKITIRELNLRKIKSNPLELLTLKLIEINSHAWHNIRSQRSASKYTDMRPQTLGLFWSLP